MRVASALREAILWCAPEMAALDYPRTRVNWGFCMDVAAHAQALLRARGITAVVVADDEDLVEPDPFMHEAGSTHEWLWVDGLHYDADALMGVPRWQDLPHFRRWASPRMGAPDPACPNPSCEECEPVFDPPPVTLRARLSPGEERRALYANAALLRSFEANIATLAALRA